MSKILKIAAGTLVGIVLLWISLPGKEDQAKVLEGIRNASWPMLIASILIGIVAHNLLRAWRWRVMLSPEKPGIGFYNLFSTILIGYAISFALPMRLGEV